MPVLPQSWNAFTGRVPFPSRLLVLCYNKHLVFYLFLQLLSLSPFGTKWSPSFVHTKLKCCPANVNPVTTSVTRLLQTLCQLNHTPKYPNFLTPAMVNGCTIRTLGQLTTRQPYQPWPFLKPRDTGESRVLWLVWMDVSTISYPECALNVKVWVNKNYSSQNCVTENSGTYSRRLTTLSSQTSLDWNAASNV